MNVVVRETPGDAVQEKEEPEKSAEDNETDKATSAATQGVNGDATLSVRDIAEMDKRVGELEKIVGASTTAVDEVRYRTSASSLAYALETDAVLDITSPTTTPPPSHAS